MIQINEFSTLREHNMVNYITPFIASDNSFKQIKKINLLVFEYNLVN